MREDIDNGSTKLVVKYGAGRRIANNDILVVHLRAAKSVEDLHDDAHVLYSTYAAGEAMTVEYHEDNLLPEVYEGMVGLPAGSTVVIELSGDSTARLDDSLYLEVWIQEVRSPGASAVETLATRDRLCDATPVNTLLAACRASRVQPNGHVLPVPVATEAHFLGICAEISKGIRVAQPKKLESNSDGTGTVVYFLVSDGLYTKLVESLEDGA